MRRLPSLNGLRAFEAAARHGSFVAAGEELNVTQAAVSRMVRLLEERLGFKLFDRMPNGLALTAQGRALQPDSEVRLATGGDINPFKDDWTCGILLGNGDWAGHQAEPMFSADLFPV